MLTDGQREAATLTYAPLPKEMMKQLETTINAVR
jgi:hypothetical protein